MEQEDDVSPDSHKLLPQTVNEAENETLLMFQLFEESLQDTVIILPPLEAVNSLPHAVEEPSIDIFAAWLREYEHCATEVSVVAFTVRDEVV